MKRLIWAAMIAMMSMGSLAQTRSHTVARGETLQSVAQKYGVTPEAIKAANPRMGNMFYAGMKLDIPAGQPAAQSQQQAAKPQTPRQVAPQQQGNPPASLLAQPQASGQGQQQASAPAGTVSQVTFAPAPDLSTVDIEMLVNAVNPYTLYRKGSVAEYAFERKGKQTKLMDGPSYIQQIVADERIENGLLVAYIQTGLLNKEHKPLKGVAKGFKELWYPVEIDTAGTYHLTHNPFLDYRLLKKRSGYGMIVPGRLKAGEMLQCSTITDVATTLVGGNLNATYNYSDWQVVGEEQLQTPAGTFQCVKLTGKVYYTFGKLEKNDSHATWWLARGIGIVRYEEYFKESEPYITMYLNNLDLK